MTGRARMSEARLAALIDTLRELAARPLPTPHTPSASQLERAHSDAARHLAARLTDLLARLPRGGG